MQSIIILDDTDKPCIDGTKKLMIQNLSIALAQLNPTVGDLAGNCSKILQHWKNCEHDLLVFSELVTCGYPPEDLILKPGFIDAIHETIDQLLKNTKTLKSAALLPTPWRENGKIYNAALLLYQGKIIGKTFKYDLPNYGVFDEKRIFTPGPHPDVIAFNGVKIGVPICEDIWKSDICAHLKSQGADILIVPNGSPFETGKNDTRVKLAQKRVQETNLPLIYVNQVGGQDELVFDGGSFVMDAGGKVIQQLPFFQECIQTCHSDLGLDPSAGALQNNNSLIYQALTLGIRDYVHKNGFTGVLLGLSGGIDSALTAALAVDALGTEHVDCVMLPSDFTAQDSLDDAKDMADRLGVSYRIFSIKEPLQAFEGLVPDLNGLSHENIQSRIRGSILMALSNSSGKMLLTTGNKSEMAVGYATLYGDMNGGFNALKDVYKTKVYELSRWRNAHKPDTALGPAGEIIPTNIITRPPSAELRADQTDQDSLPDYDILDDILHHLVENESSVDDVIAQGHDAEIVRKIYKLLNIAEYKRYQAPPGVKISSRAFGRDRRYPMTNGFR